MELRVCSLMTKSSFLVPTIKLWNYGTSLPANCHIHVQCIFTHQLRTTNQSKFIVIIQSWESDILCKKLFIIACKMLVRNWWMLVFSLFMRFSWKWYLCDLGPHTCSCSLLSYPLKDSNKETISMICWISSNAVVTCMNELYTSRRFVSNELKRTKWQRWTALINIGISTHVHVLYFNLLLAAYKIATRTVICT